MRLQTIWKNFKKSVDKHKQTWYNKYIIKKERYKTMRELKEIIAEIKEVEKRVIYLNSCYDLDSWERGELMSKEKQLANLWEELEKRVDK